MKIGIPIHRALTWIFGSAIVCNGVVFGLYWGIRYWKAQHAVDKNTPIHAIIQTGPQREAVKTAYLAELLDLSVDSPKTNREFDPKGAKQKLLSSPVIKEAEVKIAEAGIVYVDYSVRKPVALLLDYENIALDQEGYPFPLNPFFSPKNLPEIYLDYSGPIEWNRPLTGEKVELAFSLLDTLLGPGMRDMLSLQRIDVSHAFERSLGKREIVLLLEDELTLRDERVEKRCLFPRILRLSTKRHVQEISHYLKLRDQLLETEKGQYLFPDTSHSLVVAPVKIIDLRIERLAYIEEIE